VAAAAWIKQKSSLELTRRRIEECETAIALFIEIASDRPAADYQKSDVRDFKDILRALPPNRNKKRETRGLDARAAAKEADRLKMKPIAVKTINAKYIAPLSNFFEFAIGNYNAIRTNPFQNAGLPEQNSPRNEWDPFNQEALKIFFDAPLYRGCRSAAHWMEAGPIVPRDSVRFWLPLLLLYTGARVNEICKLRVKDVGRENDIDFLSIGWEEDDDSPISGRVKNAPNYAP
jgi:integrase